MPHSERIGAGVDAQVFNTNTPNSVIKIMPDIKSPDDPYVQFVQLAEAHKDNPFFPRIHKSVLRKLGDSNYELLVHMEKLHPIYSGKTRDVAKQLFDRLGIHPDITKAIQSDSDTNSFVLKDKFRDVGFRNVLKRNTKNPEFAEALEFLDPYFDEFKSDMHGGNWMMRLTSHGPQLVIIDPFMPAKILDNY